MLFRLHSLFFNSPWICRETSLSNGGQIKNNFEKIAVGLVISLLQNMFIAVAFFGCILLLMAVCFVKVSSKLRIYFYTDPESNVFQQEN
jgi:hypothetical protein